MQRFLVICAALLFASCGGRANNFGMSADAGPDDVAAPDSGADANGQAKKQVGEVCTGPSSCTDDALCIGTREGDFRCMQRCTSPYDLCLDGSVCLPVTAQEASICYIGGAVPHQRSCDNNLDCAPGLLCFGSGAEFFCQRACDDRIGSCADGNYCLRLESGAGLCREEVGAPCPGAACARNLFCSLDDPETAPHFLGGYCTAACSGDAECGGASVCRRFPESSSSICIGGCDHDSDCRFNAGYRCLDDSSCANSADSAACESFFAGARLCLSQAP